MKDLIAIIGLLFIGVLISFLTTYYVMTIIEVFNIPILVNISYKNMYGIIFVVKFILPLKKTNENEEPDYDKIISNTFRSMILYTVLWGIGLAIANYIL